jgi:hypothetical protein
MEVGLDNFMTIRLALSSMCVFLGFLHPAEMPFITKQTKNHELQVQSYTVNLYPILSFQYKSQFLTIYKNVLYP